MVAPPLTQTGRGRRFSTWQLALEHAMRGVPCELTHAASARAGRPGVIVETRPEAFAQSEPEGAHALLFELAQGYMACGDDEGARLVLDLGDRMQEWIAWAQAGGDELPWDTWEPERRDDVADRIKELEAELAELRATQGTREPERPRRKKSQPVQVFTPEEIAGILAEASDDAEGMRFAAMVALMYATGLRIGECVRLRFDSIEPSGNGVAIVQVPADEGCKTGARQVPVALERLEPWLGRYLTMREPGPWLFTTYTGYHVHPNAFNRTLKRCAANIGITRKVSAHGFRNTFATEWVAEGRDLALLQKILGHSSPAMTLRYAQANMDRAIEAVRERDC